MQYNNRAFLKNLIPVLPCYNGLFQIKIKHQTGERKHVEIPGQGIFQKFREVFDIGDQKGQKKGHQKFYLQLPFNPSALYRNKALYNFWKRVQHSIVKCNINLSRPWDLQNALQGVLSWNYQELSHKFAEVPGVKACFLWNFQFQGFSQKSENLRNQNNTKNRWLCSSSYALFILL